MKYAMKSRHSIAFLFVVFINSFVDLGHKILLQNTLFKTYHAHDYVIYSSILNAFILLPYILFFTPSGFISDKFSKPKVMFWTAAAAIPITVMITVCYYLGLFWGAYSLTLLLGLQSAINSPAKYGHIKEIYSQSQIAKANALTQTMTILAILGGTFMFTYFFSLAMAHLGQTHSLLTKSVILKAFAPLGFVLILLSSLETISTLFLAKQPPADPGSRYHLKEYVKLKYVVPYWQHVTNNKTIFICILSLSLYWAANQVILVTYGAFLKTHIPGVSTLFAQGSIAIAGIGILCGALYAGRVSKGYIETGLLPIASAAITVCLLLLAHVTNEPSILVLVLCYGFFGGLFIVPLNSLIQYHANKKYLGKILAGNNFCQNIAMFSFLVGNTVATLYHLNSVYILHVLFVMFLVSTVIATLTLPESLMRYIIATLVNRFYTLDVVGMNNIPEQGGLLLVGNHTSFIDWAILQMACPRKIRFVMERSIFQKWYLKWLFSALKMIPISRGSSKQSIESIQQALSNGDVVCIFPEGRLSRNGQLGKFHTGFHHAIKDTSAVIVPFYIRGLWGSRVSYATRLYKKISNSLLRSASIAFASPMDANSSVEEVKQVVTRLSSQTWMNYANRHHNVFDAAYLRAKKLSGHVAVIDAIGPRLTYSTLMATAFHLKSTWKGALHNQDNVGILLPTGAPGILANLSVWAMAKTVVNINFTGGLQNMQHACQAAKIKTIITSKRFIKKLTAKGIDLSELIENHHTIYMEDCITRQGKMNVLKNKILFTLIPRFIGRHIFYKKTKNNQTAAIIFSSGSEGAPKGVELTHSNLIANVKQTATVCNVIVSDVMLGVLPLFHSFGLTTSTLMPLLVGCPLICHADPTDAAMIGKLVCKHKVTVMYGTSTFFNLYLRNRKCVAEMFASLRIIIAGAEKLSDKVRTEFKLKFNKDIFEGYGSTELSPVAGCNLPNIIDSNDMHVQVSNKINTVGLPLPGSAYKIVDPNTLEKLPTGEDGLILVSGPQIMKGYLNNPEKTKSVIHEGTDARWYKTGDKGHLDSDGFLTIVDRYSRFAKVAGEMISLGAVEERILERLNTEDAEVIAVAVPNDKKGEVIYLVHNTPMPADELKQHLIESKLDNLMLPHGYLREENIPKLGTGKKDYSSAKKRVLESIGKPK